jgi:peptidylprolyl isomerase
MLPLEVSSRATYDRDGVLGMARTTEPDSAGSQFFITFGPQPALNPSQSGPGYTIFGQVVEGMDAARSIRPRDPQTDPGAPPGETLRSVRIVDRGAAQ